MINQHFNISAEETSDITVYTVCIAIKLEHYVWFETIEMSTVSLKHLIDYCIAQNVGGWGQEG